MSTSGGGQAITLEPFSIGNAGQQILLAGSRTLYMLLITPCCLWVSGIEEVLLQNTVPCSTKGGNGNASAAHLTQLPQSLLRVQPPTKVT